MTAFIEATESIVAAALERIQPPPTRDYAQAMVLERIEYLLKQTKADGTSFNDAEILYALTGLNGSAIDGFVNHISNAWNNDKRFNPALSDPQEMAKQEQARLRNQEQTRLIADAIGQP